MSLVLNKQDLEFAVQTRECVVLRWHGNPKNHPIKPVISSLDGHYIKGEATIILNALH